jgi:hypothetical protein
LDASDAAKMIRGLNDGLLAHYKCPSIILPYTSFAAVLPLIGLATLIGLASIGLLAPWMIPFVAGSYIMAFRLRFPNLSVRPVAEGLELTYSPRKRAEPADSPALSTHESIFDKLFGKRLNR